MDFVNRHATHPTPPTTTTATTASSPPPPASSSSTSKPRQQQQLPNEEQEYLARYAVVKHSWRGRYKRILCISSSTLITLDPSTLSVTNSYDVVSDYDGASPIVGREDNNSYEFNISVRTDGRGKYKGIKFSSRYRASILTELHRLRGSNRFGAVAEFPVLHLRRRTSEWVPFVS